MKIRKDDSGNNTFATWPRSLKVPTCPLKRKLIYPQLVLDEQG